MKLSSNTDFFQKKGIEIHGQSPDTSIPLGKQGKGHVESRQRKSSAEMSALIKQTIDVLEKCGFGRMSARIDQIQNDLTRERFVISVVGEFKHGKSTFLNRLLKDAAMLPVADLPTTAILTRIRYAKQPKMAVFGETGERKAILDIKKDSWNGLVANNFGKEQPKGSVIVGIPDAWIGKHNIEFVDCPGAGDLSEERAKVIGDVLNRTDGAIIALNATAALSKSEKLFIQNRILARKTPFTLIIVNKLDLVKKDERNKIIKYIKDVLALNKMDIPVYIPYNIEMPDATYESIIGMDKVMAAIVGWIHTPERQQLIEDWTKVRISEIVNTAIETLSEQEKLLKLDDKKRLEVIESKKQALSKLELEWNDLALKLQSKSNDCYTRFLEKVEEYSFDVIERLQYEVSHAGSPEKWWKEDYPYRLKVELANMSVGLENVISRLVSNDAKWFNDILNQKFRSVIQVGSIYITDKDEYKGQKSQRVLEFENLSKKQNYARICTVVLSLALAPAFGLLATMGVGTAGTLITSSVFKKKIEEQRTVVKETIAKDVPAIVIQATSNSEHRIQKLYDEMLEDSDKKKQAWLEAQSIAIENSNPSQVNQQLASIAANKAKLSELISKL
jgi:GTP-binding protein EngB required for normal cell division